MPESVGQVKHDGEEIKRIPLSSATIRKNYKDLLKNPPFLFGSIATGLMGLPCVAWIALAPVLLISEAKLSVIEYALWQIPVFGATICGNWVLQLLTHKGKLRQILYLGSTLLGIGLLTVFLLPLIVSHYFIWLMPGLILYFFGFGISCAPLNRLTLFSTSVSKGTASALMSIISMSLQGLGIEVANYLNEAHSNVLFGLYCALVGLVYFIFLSATLRIRSTKEDLGKI
jgi:DHA1 family multidrug/chloramphenicol efflux transport protein-like MFS transporter